MTPCNAPGSLVLDPYLGRGTTAISAPETGFRFIGIEREEEYYQIAITRPGKRLDLA